MSKVTGTCARCGLSRPSEEWGAHKSYCLTCLAEYQRQNREKRGEAARIYSREYRRQWMAANPEKRAEYARRSLYGLEPEIFQAWWDAQDGRCAICDIELTEGKGPDKLAVDHIEGTKTVRGLLCQKCNLFIGQASHDVSRLQAAIEYLLGSVVELVDTASLNNAAAKREGSTPFTPTQVNASS